MPDITTAASTRAGAKSQERDQLLDVVEGAAAKLKNTRGPSALSWLAIVAASEVAPTPSAVLLPMSALGRSSLDNLRKASRLTAWASRSVVRNPCSSVERPSAVCPVARNASDTGRRRASRPGSRPSVARARAALRSCASSSQGGEQASIVFGEGRSACPRGRGARRASARVDVRHPSRTALYHGAVGMGRIARTQALNVARSGSERLGVGRPVEVDRKTGAGGGS